MRVLVAGLALVALHADAGTMGAVIVYSPSWQRVAALCELGALIASTADGAVIGSCPGGSVQEPIVLTTRPQRGGVDVVLSGPDALTLNGCAFEYIEFVNGVPYVVVDCRRATTPR